jgi:hypothetical protein
LQRSRTGAFADRFLVGIYAGMRASLLALVVVLAGCGAAAAPQAVFPPIEQSATVDVAPSGGTVTFPNVAGFSGTFLYSANDAPAGVTASITTIDAPAVSIVPGPTPPGNLPAAYEFELNQTVTFVDWYRLLTTITVPSSIASSGHTFREYGYDLTNAVGEGYNPGTINGNTISFAPGPGPVKLLANHKYLLVLSVQ